VARVLPLRSNIPAISKHLFERLDPDFFKKAKELGGGFVVGGGNYGQGSSREHAALGPMFVGIRAIIVKSYARIHQSNLINFGILPLTFKDEREFERVGPGDQLKIENVRNCLQVNGSLTIQNVTKVRMFEALHGMNQREIDILLAGGLLNYTRGKSVYSLK